MQSKIILIHHHIFKNAGTSFNHALKQYFQSEFFEYDLPNSKIVTQQHLVKFIAEHPSASVISSHHACLPTPQGENYQTISSILLRQPLARIESIYNFEKKQTANTEGAKQAKKLDFQDYVLWRLTSTPNMFCNYQTHYCSRIQQADLSKKPTAENLTTAIANIRQCAIVGTVEKYNDFLEIALDKLRQFFPDLMLKYTVLNQTSALHRSAEEIRSDLSEKLGEELVGELEEKNQLDLKLYQVAEQIVTNNLESITCV